MQRGVVECEESKVKEVRDNRLREKGLMPALSESKPKKRAASSEPAAASSKAKKAKKEPAAEEEVKKEQMAEEEEAAASEDLDGEALDEVDEMSDDHRGFAMESSLFDAFE